MIDLVPVVAPSRAAWIPFDPELVGMISADMELRVPNEIGLAKIAEAIQFGEGREVVCDLATGVGKTYLAASVIEYLARQGVRNVLFVTPGTTIYDKTIANFTPGSPKYVAGGTIEPVLITAENFQRGQVGDALHDDSKLKLFVFNVQQLIRPTAKTSRKTRSDDEYIGGALYDHLRAVDDLIVIADEHHVYRAKAKAFSDAIRDLDPRALVGLTATPDQSDIDAGRIIYRYSLAEAIRDELVKIPVIVYRQDGLKDIDTQLADACRLRADKELVWHAYADGMAVTRVSPVLFVVCQTIKDAEQVSGILAREDLLAGDGQVLLITSQSSDDALAALAAVESSDSPVRAIVSVDKLKEGWDVRNIGVIVGLRALASQTLTEQILGRGLRLPFGARVGVGAIDQVDIVAHESYKELLRNKDALLERLTPPAGPVSGTGVPAPTNPPTLFQADGTLLVTTAVAPAGADVEPGNLDGLGDAELLLVADYDQVRAQRENDRTAVNRQMGLTAGAPTITFPRRDRVLVPVKFSVSSIDPALVSRAGKHYSTNLDVPLTRRALGADVGLDGTVTRMRDYGVEGGRATQRFVSADEVRSDLVMRIANNGLVEPSFVERAYVADFVDLFLAGAGVTVEYEADWTSPRASAAEAALAALVVGSFQANERKPQFTWKPQQLTGARKAPALTRSRWDDFVKADWYDGWDRSVTDSARFDSLAGEFAFAQRIDASDSVAWWLRLYLDDPVWIGLDGSSRYFPDFIVVDKAAVHWLVEVKSDSAAANDSSVAVKAAAAREWAQAVRESKMFGEWRYLLVTEAEIKSKLTWEAMAG